MFDEHHVPPTSGSTEWDSSLRLFFSTQHCYVHHRAKFYAGNALGNDHSGPTLFPIDILRYWKHPKKNVLQWSVTRGVGLNTLHFAGFGTLGYVREHTEFEGLLPWLMPRSNLKFCMFSITESAQNSKNVIFSPVAKKTDLNKAGMTAPSGTDPGWGQKERYTLIHCLGCPAESSAPMMKVITMLILLQRYQTPLTRGFLAGSFQLCSFSQNKCSVKRGKTSLKVCLNCAEFRKNCAGTTVMIKVRFSKLTRLHIVTSAFSTDRLCTGNTAQFPSCLPRAAANEACQIFERGRGLGLPGSRIQMRGLSSVAVQRSCEQFTDLLKKEVLCRCRSRVWLYRGVSLSGTFRLLFGAPVCSRHSQW